MTSINLTKVLGNSDRVPRILFSVIRKILSLAIRTQYRLVTERQTHRHRTISYAMLAEHYVKIINYQKLQTSPSVTDLLSCPIDQLSLHYTAVTTQY